MPEKFHLGNSVRVKTSMHMLTGSIAAAKDVQGRYLVKYDEKSNDTSVLREGLHYEDDLESCQPPTVRA